MPFTGLSLTREEQLDPDKRNQRRCCSVNLYEPPRTFPSILYAGDGMRLASDGPDTFNNAQGKALPFKVLIHGQPPRPGIGSDIRAEDRIWVPTDSLGALSDVPAQLLPELQHRQERRTGWTSGVGRC